MSAGPRWEASADVVVVGSGVAGLTAAITAHRLGLRTLLVTKGPVASGNTGWAQGGVAVVLPSDRVCSDRGETDSVRAHAEDTVTAAAGLADEAAVASIVGAGPAAVRRLVANGARFDRVDSKNASPKNVRAKNVSSASAGAHDGALENTDAGDAGDWARAREGGHSAFRVLRAGGDATGAEVQRALVAAAGRDGVPALENHRVTEIRRDRKGRVVGVDVVANSEESGIVAAPAVILATGGLGQLYRVSSNPAEATGDGIGLALRAGARVADLEFVQFHPTALAVDRPGRAPLVTEALRGEGATLIDADGTSVMAGIHPMGDLAPRDVVSGAIVRRLAAIGGDRVFLDATHVDRPEFQHRFPTVYAACRAAGIDPVTEPIPVAPAAHFGCGGVVTTVDGRTEVPGLYAAGEVARTGLHGANRLASNSLLEGLVIGERTAEAVRRDLRQGALAPISASDSIDTNGTSFDNTAFDNTAMSSLPSMDDVREAMSRYVGIGRDADGLAKATDVLAGTTSTGNVSPDATANSVETKLDAVLAARAIVMGAQLRSESRGCHLRTDFPAASENWRHSITLALDTTGALIPMRADHRVTA